MGRTLPTESDLFDQHEIDRRIERDEHREGRRRQRIPIMRSRVANECHFADVLSASAYQEWLADNWSGVLGANIYKAAQFAARGIGPRS